MPNERLATASQKTREGRERTIEREISLLELAFADAQWKSRKDPASSFTEILSQHADMIQEIANEFRDDVKNDPAMREVIQTLKDEIDAIHGESAAGWRERVLERLAAFRKRWCVMREPRPRSAAGIFNYEMRDVPELERFGIGGADPVLEIHVKGSMDPAAGVGATNIKTSLQRIAEMIVYEHPEARAVVGRSWLMDHPLVKRLGFTVPDDINMPQNGYNFWLQFINKTGHVDAERARRLIETGEAPFRTRLGFMPVEAFLRKYLPADLRAKPVVLRRIRPEMQAEEARFREETKRLQDAWPDMTVENLEGFFRSCPVLIRRLDELGLTQEALEQFRREKQAGHTLTQLGENGELKRMGKALRDLEESRRYEPFEVDLSS